MWELPQTPKLTHILFLQQNVDQIAVLRIFTQQSMGNIGSRQQRARKTQQTLIKIKL